MENCLIFVSEKNYAMLEDVKRLSSEFELLEHPTSEESGYGITDGVAIYLALEHYKRYLEDAIKEVRHVD